MDGGMARVGEGRSFPFRKTADAASDVGRKRETWEERDREKKRGKWVVSGCSWERYDFGRLGPSGVLQ